MNFRTLTAIAVLSLSSIFTVSAENLPADHPSAGVVKKYLESVVKQDWKTAADLLLPPSLERRKIQMIGAVKSSATMTEEATKLSMLGLKDISELEKLSPKDAYVADRKAVHDRMKISPENIKKKVDTLKINILGLVSESEGKVIHAVVRTKQDTLDSTIEELLLISLTQDKESSKTWLIVPDMQAPITTPLNAPASN